MINPQEWEDLGFSDYADEIRRDAHLRACDIYALELERQQEREERQRQMRRKQREKKSTKAKD